MGFIIQLKERKIFLAMHAKFQIPQFGGELSLISFSTEAQL